MAAAFDSVKNKYRAYLSCLEFLRDFNHPSFFLARKRLQEV